MSGGYRADTVVHHAPGRATATVSRSKEAAVTAATDHVEARTPHGCRIAGFLCLVPLAAFARDLLGRDRRLARIGSLALPTGALLWVTGNLVGLLLGRRCPTGTSHLLGGGALLLPVWLLWTGRLLRTDDRSRHAS
jgi:hypothetical protein